MHLQAHVQDGGGPRPVPLPGPQARPRAGSRSAAVPGTMAQLVFRRQGRLGNALQPDQQLDQAVVQLAAVRAPRTAPGEPCSQALFERPRARQRQAQFALQMAADSGAPLKRLPVGLAGGGKLAPGCSARRPRLPPPPGWRGRSCSACRRQRRASRVLPGGGA